MAVIGDLCESKGEITIEWKIKDFSLLPKEIDTRYDSPKFYFSGTSWDIWLYPNGQNGENNNGWLALYLIRRSNGSRVTLNYCFSLKIAGGKIDFSIDNTDVFEEKGCGWGILNFLQRSVLMDRKSEIIPTDTLIIICTLKNYEPKCVDGSLFNRLQKLSDNLNVIYENANRTDCILNVGNQSLPAHRMILEIRSPVFAAMFNHEMKENQTGEIFIDDIEESTMETMIKYIYTGDIEKMTRENVLSIYAAAEKYDLQDIKCICSDFIVLNLSVDWVCDVIKFGELYEDEKIRFCSRNYFRENVRQILKTKKWRRFAKENSDINIELFDSVVTAYAPE